MKARWWLALSLLVVAPLHAQRYEFAVDVPSDLDGLTRLPFQVLEYDFGVYTSSVVLPSNVTINAIARDGAELLFVPATPVEIDGLTFTPTMIVRRTAAGSFTLEQAFAIPAGVRIDALFLDGAGDPVLSFDVPIELSGLTFAPSDLVTVSGGTATPYFVSASVVPAYANLNAASLDENGELVVAFDVPTRLSAFDALPGTLVRWDGSGFAPVHFDPAWPASSQLRGLDISSTSAAAGLLPPTLTAMHVGDGEIQLDWMPSCAGSDSDYAVFVGTLGNFVSHTPDTCSTGGALTRNLAPPGDALYFLVVPTNGLREGSYGKRSDGSERPLGAAICLERETGACD